MPKPAKNNLWQPPPPGGDAQVLVWDPLIRIFHWGLVTCVATAWVTSDSAGAVHHVAGYVAIGLIVLRLIWGFLGTPYARFGQFVRHPATVWRYLCAIARGREARHIGHNPAGGAMVVVLLLMVTGTAATGYMLTTDRYWGVAWVGDLHAALANGLLVLIGLHVAGVLLASFRHRENLIRAMVSGYKRSTEPED